MLNYFLLLFNTVKFYLSIFVILFVTYQYNFHILLMYKEININITNYFI